MNRKLKILTVDRKNDDGYWIAGIFETQKEIADYIDRYFLEDVNFEVQEFDYPKVDKALDTGEYVYQVIVVDPETFVIEQILAPDDFSGLYIDDYPKLPLRIILSAKNASAVKQKCLAIMAKRLAV